MPFALLFYQHIFGMPATRTRLSSSDDPASCIPPDGSNLTLLYKYYAGLLDIFNIKLYF